MQQWMQGASCNAPIHASFHAQARLSPLMILHSNLAIAPSGFMFLKLKTLPADEPSSISNADAQPARSFKRLRKAGAAPQARSVL